MIGVRLLDTDVDLLVVTDEAEHARRLATQAELIDDWNLLVILTSLPRWEPVPLESLTAEECQAARQAPRGAVELTGGRVTRMAGPPLTRVLAIVTDTDWDRGLDAASRFAPVATRVLVLDHEPADWRSAVAEAAEYGIGLAIGTAAPVRMVVQPKLWREQYFTPGGWLFREQAYGAYVKRLALGERMAVTAQG